MSQFHVFSVDLPICKVVFQYEMSLKMGKNERMIVCLSVYVFALEKH